MKLIEKKELFNTDEYTNVGTTGGFIEFWDFSEANLSFENRVKAVSKVASICYGNEDIKPNFKLYDKLARESIGLPSSSFEFVPVLLNKLQYYIINNGIRSIKGIDAIPNVKRYGYYIKDKELFLTNLRALMYDLELIKNNNLEIEPIESDYWLNDIHELDIIKDNFKVFKIKGTIRDFRQHERHRRASYQELSRRYTTGNKVPLEFRFSFKVGQKGIAHAMQSIKLYYELLNEGVKSEDARDILPISLYSNVWTSYFSDGLKNYLELRTKSAAQKEIRSIAEAMKEMIEK